MNHIATKQGETYFKPQQLGRECDVYLSARGKVSNNLMSRNPGSGVKTDGRNRLQTVGTWRRERNSSNVFVAETKTNFVLCEVKKMCLRQYLVEDTNLLFTIDIQKIYANINKSDQQDFATHYMKHGLDAFNIPTKDRHLPAVHPPFPAIRTLQQLAKDENRGFPLASETLLYDTCMDDIVSGTRFETAPTIAIPTERRPAILWN
ncbi:hypothetical protein TNCV_1525351 [Trichonephila clavipes]|nr:hypothetical protein TNCV_1525351 [Trichonephila clavipes]